MIRAKLSYANVMATLALFVALGGTSYAAMKLPKNSVGTSQLRKSSVTAKKIKKNAVRTTHVLNGSLKAEDFAVGEVPTGATGAQGPAGSAGVSNLNLVSNSATATVGQFVTVSTVADCPAGQKTLGGGAQAVGGSSLQVALQQSNPDPIAFDDWRAVGLNLDPTPQSVTVSAWALCANVS
jgi:hypothetical protein